MGHADRFRRSPPDLSMCNLCGHPMCSQTHIICDCLRLSHDRAGLYPDLTVLIGQLPRGPYRALGWAHQRNLFHRPDLPDRGQLWSSEHRTLLSHQLQNFTWASTGVTQLWRQYAELIRDTSDRPPANTGYGSPGSLDLNLAVSRLPPGPMLELGRKFQLLLSSFNQPTLMARR